MSYRFIPWMLSLIVVSIFYATASAQPSHTHTNEESMMRSKHQCLWWVIQDEYDRVEITDNKDRIRHREIIDNIIRTTTSYDSPYKDSEEGIQKYYPELLELHKDPPLYIQYRYLSSYAWTHRNDNDFDPIEIAQKLISIAKRMETQEYPDFIQGSIWLRVSSLYREGGDEDHEQALYAIHHGIEKLIDAATLKEIKPEHQEYVAIRIAGEGYQFSALNGDNKDLFCKMLLDDADADPWIGYFANGQRNRLLAWESRGQSWASEVTERQWKLFERYMLRSNSYLVKAWELRPQWPEPAVEMIGNTMGGYPHQEQPEAFWFKQAITFRADHERAHSKLIYALTPRWGGSMEHMAGFTQYVIDQADHIDHMSYIFMGCVSAMVKEVEPKDANRIVEHYRPTMNRLIDEELVSPLHYKGEWQRRSLLRTIAKLNFSAGEYIEAHRLLNAGGAMTDSLHKPWTDSYKFEIFAPLLASPASEQIIEGLEAMDNDQIPKAIKSFEQAIAILENPDVTLDPELYTPYGIISELQDYMKVID